MEQSKDKIIDGRLISVNIINEIKDELSKQKITPGLAFILAGNNPSSEIYVNMKAKVCAELGYYSIVDRQPENITEEFLLKLISNYNQDNKVHGILIQLPLPKHINELKILESVDYRKDVDGFHPVNSGRLVIGEKCFIPCTPAGIHELLKRYEIKTSGKNVVVIGRSNIVGKPVANIL
ncbi:MAG TPA: tetrahydrofolate dehydrogenase/cyclohydrolase catalytic domain-containing protein, partial [Ignavibacteria bacterium]